MQFGREKELELIRSVSESKKNCCSVPQLFSYTLCEVRSASASFSQHFSSKGYFSLSGSQEVGTGGDDYSDSAGSNSPSESSNNTFPLTNDIVPMKISPTPEQSSPTLSYNSSMQSSDELRRVALRSKHRSSRAQVVIVIGQPGSVPNLLTTDIGSN